MKLSEDEINFLKLYVYVYSSNVYNKKYITKIDDLIWIQDENGNGICFRYNKDKFKALRNNKQYTFKELGLE